MSNAFSIEIKDFKRIRDVSVGPEGITLIVGSNSQGKSTLFKATEAVLRNATSDRQFRRGTAGFSYAMNIDGHRLEVKRTKKDGLVVGHRGPNDSVVDYREKLGRTSDITEVFPEFPLKPIKLKDSWFIPNLVKQGQVPIFDQVDVTELFAILYEDVAKVTQRLDALKKELSASSKAMSTNEALLDHLNSQANGYDTEMLQLDATAIQQYRPALEEILTLKAQLQQSQESVAKAQQFFADRYSWVDVLTLGGTTVDAAVEVYSRFQGAQKIKDALDANSTKSHSYRNQLQVLSQVSDESLAVVSRLVKAIPLVSRANESAARQRSLLDELQTIPEGAAVLADSLKAVMDRLSKAAPIVTRIGSNVADAGLLRSQKVLLTPVPEAVVKAELILALMANDLEHKKLQDKAAVVAEEIFGCLNQLADVDICPLCGSNTNLKEHLNHE